MSNVKAKCTKFHFRWVSTRDPAAGAHESTLCSEKNTHSHFLSYLHE